MSDKTDNLFAKPKAALPFSFDESVAEVFPDMIKRSVPGYTEIINNISKFAGRFVTSNSNCYDLGCSLGAASLAMSAGIEKTGAKIIAVDNSSAMLERCRHHIDAFKHKTPIELQLGDVQKISIQNASMVALNFTLQFIAKEERLNLLENIYQGLNSGGLLLLSEKVSFSDDNIDDLLIELHHQFKKENGYSDLEISQKRNALENVLLPETLEHHINRLKSAGFSSVSCWMQNYNFVSIIAIK
ncbi:carboxy-S-adenosyl-L-methionine synthase CmoA [Aliikangiella coralliicola]|uniref:Carboxy-S-adenosyl-L-methionine synthase n=1 Tax=Aliikangiella coralliicola TaxID=2592383 RepID=A0A545UDH1_9GAMM|nr:carboxy-S-adenosyl-L-methionine synthase CmoA [Aliikangiella coralliicola]TQV87516.1 carboxy-S-adenosyl-L-methionine synthase CmoA [Aliikangiella coralliicola]